MRSGLFVMFASGFERVVIASQLRIVHHTTEGGLEEGIYQAEANTNAALSGYAKSFDPTRSAKPPYQFNCILG